MRRDVVECKNDELAWMRKHEWRMKMDAVMDDLRTTKEDDTEDVQYHRMKDVYGWELKESVKMEEEEEEDLYPVMTKDEDARRMKIETVKDGDDFDGDSCWELKVGGNALGGMKEDVLEGP